MTKQESFKQWLTSQINELLQDQYHFILWLDPWSNWREILQDTSENNFQLWIAEEHELKTRDKIKNTQKGPRVIYLPKSREELTYLKVYEHQAVRVIQSTLVQALADYGVLIPRETQEEIQDQLPTLVKEWLDKPKSHWKELTAGNVRDTIIDNETILEILSNRDPNSLSHEKRSLFTRRIVEELGLPDPIDTDPHTWRTRALASMLYTEATQQNPQDPPPKTKKTIEDPQRERALKLLSRWSKQIDLVPKLQELIKQADETASLRYWAQNQPTLPKPLMSNQAEAIFFQQETQKLNQKPLDQIITHLKQNIQKYREHSEAFWGNPRYVDDPIPWSKLAELSETAIILHHNQDTYKNWKTTKDVVTWYTETGWKIDHAAENLFINYKELPGKLLSFRTTLQKRYTRFLDHTNQTFSELIAAQGIESIDLQYPGEITENYIKTKETTAFLVLDACRYELGQRLTEKINKAEPVKRAQIKTSIAPIPTITELGMAFTLPGAPNTIKPQINDNKWLVSTRDPTNLSIKNSRIEWLRKNYKLKDNAFLKIDDFLSKPQTQKNPRETRIHIRTRTRPPRP
ncbi:PglZ domain-containing protein [Thaumarchaeota archaeon SCGC AB-539-E09]|nr:PglZ domain-containing protein [Thaumarchaeota archaeon SCGC AB-539-E09]